MVYNETFMKKVNLAIIGTGNWGLNYVRIFSRLPNARIKFLVDKSDNNLRKAKEFAPEAIALNDYRNFLKEKGWDAGVVATPAPTHFPIVFELLSRGKDVLVEKPLALNSKDAQTLFAIAKRKRKKLMVGHILLYHPAVRYLKNLIKRNIFGRIDSLLSLRFNFNGLSEEDCLFGLACHDIAIANYLLSSPPEFVRAMGNEKESSFILIYPKGVKFYGEVGFRDGGEEKVRSLFVFGEKKEAFFDDTREEKLVIRDKKKTS
ncbi:MAG: Gfo/Idh/MocA family oxidoreductase, partial [candidate division WOR-3 bacterium]